MGRPRTDKSKHRCYHCKYLTVAGEFAVCNYFEMTGKLRTWPQGRYGPKVENGSWDTPCYCWEKARRPFEQVPEFRAAVPKDRPKPKKEPEKKDGRKGPRCKWDYDKALGLYMEGKTLAECARAVGTAAINVQRYAERYGWAELRKQGVKKHD